MGGTNQAPDQVRRQVRPESTPWLEVRDLVPTLEKVRPFTMVAELSLIDLARQVGAVLTHGIPGDLVECGVWRGGASFLMADLLRQAGVRDRKVWLVDSFEGIPSPEEIDGAAALAWAQSTDGPWYFDNLRVSLEQVQRSAEELGLASYTECVKGWFDQTLPAYRERIGPIAILRIDADWYSSVRCCLDNLYDQVVDGGFVILDDYYTFDGCAIAVHEFLGGRRLAHPLESPLGAFQGLPAIFRKGKTTWHDTRKQMLWLHLVHLATQEIATIIPPGDTFILIDEDQWGSREVVSDRRAIPFLERDGQHWGPPPDDDTGIRELERLRQAGARFMVFAWPAFWWLEYYAGLHQYLRSQFRCALENERLIVFDLRA